MHELTPREIVAELDRYIIGQRDAKRAVAIAIRNRWRRQQLPDPLRREVTPKNIIMIGPTGVGKTEIARRLAQLVHAPFLKIEATKYTEVGYHGRDVESMVRDLVEVSVSLVRGEERQRVEEKARQRARERLLELLAPAPEPDPEAAGAPGGGDTSAERRQRTRDKLARKLDAGELDDRTVELSVEQRTLPVQIFSSVGMEQMDVDFQNMFEKLMPRQSQRRQLAVKDARRILIDQEIEALLDREKIAQEAVRRAEENGIIFLDELDKICGPESSHGPDVSRQGVQRDLLPIVEGTTVLSRHGPVRTDHVLFIAAGAFHRSKPSDLMPELQGRFPIRVELADLTKEDFLRILREPENSLTRQYQALLSTEQLRVEYSDDAIQEMAEFAYRVNKTTQNIGARRLHTILEKLMEELSFDAPERSGQEIRIDAAYVRDRLESISQDEDLSRFIL